MLLYNMNGDLTYYGNRSGNLTTNQYNAAYWPISMPYDAYASKPYFYNSGNSNMCGLRGIYMSKFNNPNCVTYSQPLGREPCLCPIGGGGGYIAKKEAEIAKITEIDDEKSLVPIENISENIGMGIL